MLRLHTFFLLPVLCLSLVPALAAAAEARLDPAHAEFFEKHVRPVLVDRCVSCHGPKVQRGGLRLDSRKAILQGGDSGPALVVGQPEKSLLVKAARHEGDLKMPPKEKDKLSATEIAALVRWVQIGAPWPASDVPTQPVVSTMAEMRKKHWSFRLVTRPPVPEVHSRDRVANVLDRFLLHKLEAKSLSFAPQADRRTLIRRVTFDLTGLPPTPEEVDDFINDQRADAYERLVERLLASPAYGERWGRHWLDVARYSDTKGYVFQQERRYPYSYTYRDYVVTSFNEDLPYDQFIMQQLAADRLDLGEDKRALAAMGFLTLGRRFLNNIHDITDDRIDVVTRGLMGLTVSCARCHDHKYDPIPTRDYYSLHGVFLSSNEPAELPLLSKADGAAAAVFNKELQERQAKADRLVEEAREQLRKETGNYLLAVRDARNAPGEKALATGDTNKAHLARWQAYLNNEAIKKHHPVLAPYVAFARLSQGEFAKQAPALAERIAANREAGKPIHPLVARAFAAGPAPKSLIEVVERYEKLFAAATKPGDKETQAIRDVLHGPIAPASVPANEIERHINRAQRNRLNALRLQVERWKATGPGSPARAHVLVDNASPHNPRVLVRGNPNNPGVPVPRQFLEILSPERKPFTNGSGRLDLARAIANRDNPLTARVMVNRLWMHHFGKGIVTTPGDFGTRGEPPSHPELLDWLASEFVESGWSIKHMHRLMLRSAAYRQSSADRTDGLAVDPENALLWKMNRRRLEFEPLRDAILAASGSLDRAMGGAGVDITTSPYPPRRSVYGFIDRQNLPGVFRTFDLASPDVSTPQRHATTVPQQALFLMNGPFVLAQAKALAARTADAAKGDEERIDALHRLAYGRRAERDEMALGLEFVRGGGTWEQYAQVLLLANEFAFVD